MIHYKVKSMLGHTTTSISSFDQIKMFIYDGHDTQAVSLLRWLNVTNFEYPLPTKFASQISFELFSSSECLLSENPSEDCFAIQMIFNEKVMELEGSCKDPSLCTYPEFTAYIDSIWYSGPNSDDFEAACLTDF